LFFDRISSNPKLDRINSTHCWVWRKPSAHGQGYLRC